MRSRATVAQMATIRAQRIDATARGMMMRGVYLAWDQIDSLGDEATDWIRSRLRLTAETADVGVLYRPRNPHAVALGRKGGKANKGRTSEAKAAASRENGKRGGRPKKATA